MLPSGVRAVEGAVEESVGPAGGRRDIIKIAKMHQHSSKHGSNHPWKKFKIVAEIKLNISLSKEIIKKL